MQLKLRPEDFFEESAIPVAPRSLWRVGDFFSRVLGVVVAVSLKVFFRPFFHIAGMFNATGETISFYFGKITKSKKPFAKFLKYAFLGTIVFPVYVLMYAPLQLLVSMCFAVYEGIIVGWKRGVTGALRSIFNSVNWENKQGKRFVVKDVNNPDPTRPDKTVLKRDFEMSRDFLERTSFSQINPFAYYFGKNTLIGIAVTTAIVTTAIVTVMMLSGGFAPIPFILGKLGYSFSGVFYNLLITPLASAFVTFHVTLAATFLVEAALYATTFMLYELGSLLSYLNPRLYYKENRVQKEKAFERVGRPFRENTFYEVKGEGSYSFEIKTEFSAKLNKRLPGARYVSAEIFKKKEVGGTLTLARMVRFIVDSKDKQMRPFWVDITIDLSEGTYKINSTDNEGEAVKCLAKFVGPLVTVWQFDAVSKKLISRPLSNNSQLVYRNITSKRWLYKKDLTVSKGIRGVSNFIGFFVLLPFYVVLTPFFVIPSVLNDVFDTYKVKMSFGNFVLATLKSIFLSGVALPLLLVLSPFIAVCNLAVSCRELKFSDALKGFWKKVNVADAQGRKFLYADMMNKTSVRSEMPSTHGHATSKLFPGTYYFGIGTIFVLAGLVGAGCAIATSILMSSGTAVFALAAAKLGIALTFTGAPLLLTPLGAAVGAFALGAVAVLTLAAAVFLVVGVMNVVGNFFRYIDPDDDQEYHINNLPNDLYTTLDAFFKGYPEKCVMVEDEYGSILLHRRSGSSQENRPSSGANLLTCQPE